MTTTSSGSSGTSSTASPSATPVAPPTPSPTPTPAPAASPTTTPTPAAAPTPAAPPSLVPPGRCIFPHTDDAHGFIQYPDAIGFFSQTDLSTVPGYVIAWYSGALTTLTAYAYPPAPTPAPSWDITRKAFMLRFTGTELTAIYTAAATTPAVQADLAVFNNSSYISLQDPTTVALLGNLVAANLITTARQSAILSQPAQPGEQYTGPL